MALSRSVSRLGSQSRSGDFTWPGFVDALASLLTRSTFSKTMPVGLRDFTSEFTINWGGMCALAVLMIIPALILTFIVQKHLIAGLTFGGVKG